MGNDFCPDATVRTILKATEELNTLNDVDTILDKILWEARQLSGADAGSIFLVKDGQLNFSYVQNDTLFQTDESNAAIYTDFALPMTEDSIVGYAALTGETLVIDDAYEIEATKPYSFNKSFDEKSGYRTTSMLNLPIKSHENKLVGVMQLINARNRQGEVGPFPAECVTYLPLLANNASVAIQRGIINRELILRMMQMAEMRDPTETGPHVQRVGAYCAEIYHRMATKRGVCIKETKRYRDHIRLAAMLHDVGKVGISDTILKKPGKLTNEEFAIIKMHTVMGARLFKNQTSDLDHMSMEIALRHHEKWAGNGYPGNVPDIWSDSVQPGTPLTGKAIPLSARICAVADVFDALTSHRSYKDAWPNEKAYMILQDDAGTHFDPEVVEAFMDITGVIKAIQAKYQEQPHD
ncbi:HD domain-containing phosphohydrolase [Salidesulfovibrio onnuriiensis]|uniref:HD domain-containing phosphohydrolase n=1 Tax=Salidesulfovibrio onnuriiensis TaxID=2583823 RepID=UPI0011C6F1CB|nr:HD domain-containing phosphohydrolase [Salidesulfovibrio onnuriiensis]